MPSGPHTLNYERTQRLKMRTLQKAEVVTTPEELLREVRARFSARGFREPRSTWAGPGCQRLPRSAEMQGELLASTAILPMARMEQGG